MNCVEKILELMKQKNINNSAMEQIAGIYNGSINTWKKGKAKPSADALLKIANYFNVSVDYLLGREEIKKVPAEAEALENELKERGITQDMWAKLNEEKKPAISMTDFIEKCIEFNIIDEDLNKLDAFDWELIVTLIKKLLEKH